MKKVGLIIAILMQATLIADCFLTRELWQSGFAIFVMGWLLYLLFDLFFSKPGPGRVPPTYDVPQTIPTPEPGGKSHTSQYEEKISYFERYVATVKEKLGEKLGARAANDLRLDVEALLGGKDEDGNPCEGRINEVLRNQNRAKGLVVGRVQSGKTQNFTGVITKAIDEGWKVIILLTSSNKSLKSQTVARLKKDFCQCGLFEDKYVLNDDFCQNAEPYDDGKIYVGVALKESHHMKGLSSWLDVNREHLQNVGVVVIDDEADNATQNTVAGADDWSDVTVLRYADRAYQEGRATGDERWLRVSEWIQDLVKTEDGDSQDENRLASLQETLVRRRIGNGDNEVKVKEIISGYAGILRLNRKVKYGQYNENSLGAPELSGFVESYFTLSGTGRGHSRGDDFRAILKWFLEVRKERSMINQSICDMVNPDKHNFQKLAYVGYTATPYANFLNERQGANNPLELDFVQSMHISPAYLGLLEIFGEKTEDETDNRKPRVPIVKDIGGSGNGDNGEIQEELKNAIKWTFCCAAIRRANRKSSDIGTSSSSDSRVVSRPNRWTTTIVNLSRNTDDHDSVRTRIERYISKACSFKDDFKEACLAIFDEYSNDINADMFKKEFPAYPLDVKDIKRLDVEKNIEYFIESHHKVITLNSDSQNVGNYHNYIQDDEANEELNEDWLWIVVGGNCISRGLTFDGLVSSYFDRDGVSVNVDTLTQMGRWFGYRVGYELLPRVWMPTGTVATMREICELEEDMHKQISDAFIRNDADFKRYPVLLQTARRLTGRDNAQEDVQGIDNPFVTRDFIFGNEHGVEIIGNVVANIRKEPEIVEGQPQDNGHVYRRQWSWQNVPVSCIRGFVKNNGITFWSEETVEDISSILEKMEQQEIGALDVVLYSPDNGKNTVQVGGIPIHESGISEYQSISSDCIRFGKFYAPYDAWKVFVDDETVNAVQDSYGNRANTKGAINELYTGRTRPVVQIGFIHNPVDKNKPLPYLSIFWPGRSQIARNRVCRGNVLDDRREATSQTSNNQASVTHQLPETKFKIPRVASAGGNNAATLKSQSESRTSNEEAEVDRETQKANAIELITVFLQKNPGCKYWASDLWGKSGCRKAYPNFDTNGKDVLPTRYIDDVRDEQDRIQNELRHELETIGIICEPEKPDSSRNKKGRVKISWMLQ